jgi:hypothetical protein
MPDYPSAPQEKSARIVYNNQLTSIFFIQNINTQPGT